MDLGKFSSEFLLFALLMNCLPVFAQAPPLPPVLIGANYDLDTAIAEVPFNVLLPADPIITSEAVCATEAEIMASLSIDGRRTIIAPGNYSFSSLSIGGNNKHILFQDGAHFSLSGFFFPNASAVILENASITASGGFAIDITGAESIALKRLNAEALQAGIYIRGASRVLLESSSLTAATGPIFFAGPETSHDVVLANSEFVSLASFGTANSWSVRWSGPVNNTVAVDSRFRSLANVALRYESFPTNGYFARNQIEVEYYAAVRTARDGEVSGTAVTNWWFVDNEIYAVNDSGSGQGVARVDVGSYPVLTNIVATGNRTFGPQNVNNAGFRTAQSTWTTSDNLHTLTSGYPTPPVWEIR